MPVNPRVIVVGTTADYIDWIRRAHPKRALFVTDPDIRRQAAEPPPDPSEEILCGLTAPSEVLKAIETHMGTWAMRLSGVACFDCESMLLAAEIAAAHHLPYPSAAAIRRCRDKFIAKQIWRAAGVPCPRPARLSSAADAAAFSRKTRGPIVLKPATGSGSELVFACSGPEEAEAAFTTIEAGLGLRRENRLYRSGGGDAPDVIAETLVAGEEFSCDFMVHGPEFRTDRRVEIIRMTRKIRSPQDPFGTIRGYVIVHALPGIVRTADLNRRLLEAAETLGIVEGICMADLIVNGDGPCFLELTPRPGGDCLPPLLREAAGIDIIGLVLDAAEKKPLELKHRPDPRPVVGLRLLAGEAGVVEEIDWQLLAADPRVRQVNIIRKPADTVRMPPEDYDSWLLGHVIFAPSKGGADLAAECEEVAGRLTVRMASC